MMDWRVILQDGLVYSMVGGVYLILLLVLDNRMFLNKGDYPDDVLAAVPPRTEKETRKAVILSIPWFIWTFVFPLFSTLSFARQSPVSPPFPALFAHAFLIFVSFWLVDLIILDGLIFCLITPNFVVIPGTEGFPGYKDFGMHLRGHITKGLPYLALSGFVVAGVVWLFRLI